MQLITAVLGHSRAAAFAQTNAPHLGLYLSTITSEWLLLGAVVAGIYLRRNFFLRALSSRTPPLGQSLALGVPIYLISLVAVGIVRGLLYFTPIPHEVNLAVILAMAPHGLVQFVCWFGLSLSAGVCEELIFRGYLLQQLTAWTGRPIVAIVLGGLLFGGVHLYEGLGAILPLATLGIFYGFVVRHYKGDLRAVMVAHTLQDFLVAFLVLAKPFLDRYQPTH